MKKHFSLLLLIFTLSCLEAQDLTHLTQNLQKYWDIRNKLLNHYVAVSANNEKGTNIPAHSFNLTPIKDNQGNITRYSSTVSWADGNCTLQQYIGMLATEYRLLQYYNQDITETKNLLYYALQALERLDLHAEQYWRNQTTPQSGDLNGFFIRDDIDNSIINYNPLFSGYSIQSTYMQTVNGTSGQLSSYKCSNNFSEDGYPKEQSEDCVWNYLPYLALVTKLVDDPTIKQKASDIAYRMVNCMHAGGRYFPGITQTDCNLFEIIFENCKLLTRSCQWDNNCWQIDNPVKNSIVWEGGLVDEIGLNGSSIDGVSYGFAEAGVKITNQNLHYGSSGSKKDYFTQMINQTVGDNYQYLMLASVIGPDVVDGGYSNFMSNFMKNDYHKYEHIRLIYAILNGKDSYFYQLWPNDFNFLQNLLNSCPPCGPYDFGAGVSANGLSPRPDDWSSDNRLIWPGDINQKMNGTQSYYSGLDYLLLHNLVWLTVITPDSPTPDPTYFIDCDAYTSTNGDYVSPYDNIGIGCYIPTDMTGSGNLTANVSITFVDGFEIHASPDLSQYFSVNGGTPYHVANPYPVYKKSTPASCNIYFDNAPSLRSDMGSNNFSNTFNNTPQNITTDALTDVSVSPNPTSGLLTIDIPNLDNNTAVTIYDYSGQKVYSGGITDAKTVIDISSYTTGVYMIKITTNEMSKVVKVIKN